MNRESPSWQAQWLGALEAGGPRSSPPATFFRRVFKAKNINSAVLRVTALGLYEIEINGRIVGDQVLAPGWTSYNHRIYFQNYDVTSHLHEGPNAIGVILGDGWYCGHIANQDRQLYGERPQFTLQLGIVDVDGRRTTVFSDTEWKASTGPLLENDLIMGECYDARLELDGWASAHYDDSSWSVAQVMPAPAIAVEHSPGPPVRRHEVFKPVRTFAKPHDGKSEATHILDFGQNISGRLRIQLTGTRGARVVIRHGEMLDSQGDLYTENLRSARATDTYILRGGGLESWEPRFTFHGFRYAETTTTGEVKVIGAEAIALYSDLPLTGEFSCSHPLINQLASNIHWGLKGNFLDIPTDCPQRDERLGWTGDAQAFVRTASLHRNIQQFFHKWLQDMRDSQRPSGAIPSFCPGGPGAFDNREDGGPAWSDAVFICPWVIYEQYGDHHILADHYACMRRYLDFVTTQRVKDGIREHPDVMGWHGYGDWLACDGSNRKESGTPEELIGTAFLAEAARIMADTAEILGKKEDAPYYQNLRFATVEAFNRRYVMETGILTIPTQTAHVLALHFQLLPKNLRQTVATELVRLIQANGNRMSTGFVGTPYLLHVLEAHGYLDVAYRLLEQEENPSWLMPVKNGATTVWERWDSWSPEQGFHPEGMNSFNHYALGSVGEWLFSSVAGIVPASPGYQKILFKPRPGGTMNRARASLITPQGRVSIEWKLQEEVLHLQLEVPKGGIANLDLTDSWIPTESGPFSTGIHSVVASRGHLSIPATKIN